MKHSTLPSNTDLQIRLQRSRGRGGRVFSINCKVTAQELQKIEHAAMTNSKAISEWAREVLIEVAGNNGPDAVLVELVATRMLLVNMVKMIGQGLQISDADYAKINTQVQSAKRRVASEIAEQTKRLNSGKES